MALSGQRQVQTAGRPRGILSRDSVPPFLKAVNRAAANGRLLLYLKKQRWYRAKGRSVSRLDVADYAVVTESRCVYTLLILKIFFTGGKEANSEIYFVPLAVCRRERVFLAGRGFAAASFRAGKNTFLLVDAFLDPHFRKWYWGRIREGVPLESLKGEFVFRPRTPLFSERALARGPIRRLETEQSNTSLVLDRRLILKIYRKLEEGIGPEAEMLDFLNGHGYRSVPGLKADLVYRTRAGIEASAGVVQNFIPNQGDGWAYALKVLSAFYREFSKKTFVRDAPFQRAVKHYLSGPRAKVGRLGELTGQMHCTLACDVRRPEFAPEPISGGDVARWSGRCRQLLRESFAVLGRKLRDLDGSPEAGPFRKVLDSQGILARKVREFGILSRQGILKIRHHGDYHLGQVLNGRRGWVLFDFEGEPLRSIEERKRKVCALKDVAGMLRSLNYAVHVSAAEFSARRIPADKLTLLQQAWERLMREAFLGGYFSATLEKKVRFVPGRPEDALRIIKIFELEKAVYELYYELNNRPAWVFVPLAGIERLADEDR